MRKQVGVMVAACFYYSGLVKLAHWWRQRSGQHLVILNYHRATGGDLRRHLLYLRHHYRMLHLDEALEELYMPGQKKGVRDQRTPLVLTFDDGYSDNYLHAFVLACELQAPISIFLIPGYAESSDYFWWQEGKRLVRRAEVTEVTFEGRTYHLSQSGERDILTQAIDARLRYATSVTEREAFLGTMRKALAVPSSITVEEEATLPLTWAEIGKMAESGWVSFGAHTMHHPVLAHLADPVEVRSEVGECRKVLEQQLGHPVRTFAYPIGKLKDIGEEGLRAVQEAGYDWAVTTMNGTNTPQSDPYQLRRVSGDVSRHWLVMAAEVSGLWHFFFGLRKKL